MFLTDTTCTRVSRLRASKLMQLPQGCRFVLPPPPLPHVPPARCRGGTAASPFHLRVTFAFSIHDYATLPRQCARSRLKADVVITRAVTLFSFNARNFRTPARSSPPPCHAATTNIDALARIKWLNTLSRLILPEGKRDADSRREEESG